MVCGGSDAQHVPVSYSPVESDDLEAVNNQVVETSVTVPCSSLCKTPVLDLNGQCHCPNFDQEHVPVLAPQKGTSFPACRDKSLRLLYIDDALIATPVHLDRSCVPLLPTYGPHGKLGSCGLGIPGGWLALQHRIRDVDQNDEAIGMRLNAKKTNLLFINTRNSLQAKPFISLREGDP